MPASLAPDHSLRTGARAQVRVRFDLTWRSEEMIHTDSRVFPQIDLWRDLLPPPLEAALLDRAVGEGGTLVCAPGELVPAPEDRLRERVPLARFCRSLAGGGTIAPRVGRYYPRGILRGVEGIVRADRRPFRVTGLTPDTCVADLNHPLAERAIELTFRIESVRPSGDQRGGRCLDVVDALTADGPGMQARGAQGATDFWSDEPFSRLDAGPDSAFYAIPRLVDHLDRAAIGEISGLYARLIPPRRRILDLMTSWHSHLAPCLEPLQVVGLGMNRDELEANPVLTERIVHDLNHAPRLPFDDAAFDAVVCTVSVEYLTRPFEVLAEVRRVLAPGGLVVLTVSNRWFPPKVVRIWQELHAFERMALMLEYLRRAEGFGDLQTWSLRGVPRPTDDKYADRLAESDPVFAVWGTRR
jgi:SAM-dependent methyltransferase/FKBP-type peptidyl-prolyl cis-trans isomerase 2